MKKEHRVFHSFFLFPFTSNRARTRRSGITLFLFTSSDKRVRKLPEENKEMAQKEKERERKICASKREAFFPFLFLFLFPVLSS